ncbi:MAG: hypothetical protein CSA65_01620 [Proteobacteria bacterium]|nr:MAG: hypothetical protein CSA65_01620 [Pseudomonadota bacterium]
MRILAATLALTATVLCALLAGGYLLSSRTTTSASTIRLRARADQLREASDELLDPDALAARRAAQIEAGRAAAAEGKSAASAAPTTHRHAGHAGHTGSADADGLAVASRHHALGVALAAGAGLGLLAVLLLLFNRARRVAMVGVLVGGLVGVLGLVLEGFVVLFVVITGLQALALLLAWRAKRRPARATPSSTEPSPVAPTPPAARSRSSEQAEAEAAS